MLTTQTSSLIVPDPAIKEALDLVTGEIISLSEFVGNDYDVAIRRRMKLREGIASGNPLLACPLCHVPVHLVSLSDERRFYLRHETEDHRCPLKTKGEFSEKRILAMKYDGARESKAHQELKAAIAESLRSDPDFSDVRVESIWRGEEANTRRKPDVMAVWKKTIPVAFEVQLSTTFLRVIAERREFYLKNGGLLFWIFRDFDMGNARLTMEDVFYNNNRNAFVVNENTLLASKSERALMLDCIWSEPSMEEGIMLWTQQRRLVKFSELTIDRESQRAFYFDADAAKIRCDWNIQDSHLRKEFRDYWISHTRSQNQEKWLILRDRFGQRGLILPEYPRKNGLKLVPLLDTLYSAVEGTPVGWGHDNLVKVAHHVFDRYKEFLWPFKLLLFAHSREEHFREHDSNCNWNNKVKRYKEGWKNGDPTFSPDRQHDRLLQFLFPEIADKLPSHPA